MQNIDRRTTGPTRHLRWLAFVPLVPAALLLFVGLAWLAIVQVSVGLALLFVAAVIWRYCAGTWPERWAQRWVLISEG